MNAPATSASRSDIAAVLGQLNRVILGKDAQIRLCIACQDAADREDGQFSGYNRRGSKDSQLR